MLYSIETVKVSLIQVCVFPFVIFFLKETWGIMSKQILFGGESIYCFISLRKTGHGKPQRVVKIVTYITITCVASVNKNPKN